MKKSSEALFWAKHIGLALALVIIAAVVITLRDRQASEPVPEGQPEKKSLSQGMTDFYASHKLSSTKPFKDDIGDFVMELSEDETPLTDRLKGMESTQKPVSSRWVGEHKYRSFKAGSTLREAITSYAQLEGMQVIWELDKDFIVKHHFQVESTIIGSIKQIASAIDASFEKTVVVYMCKRQRSLVITANDTEYMQNNCEKLH
ncbi:toxin co-regulated pilus biosynthesis Q family protein [Aestuariibacter sp. AA17]|uniref:Toxin co-regulated pilus biosynthesis Q family protein n=1 Tax=Fluctibacter corallii TaxID=2984329 RepID=A0ABT3A4J1_9ALTE|nr:toxin co-regulated pilus biosynthesis Q family protein [Aestuariibacter sp. AA17]MCV2883604.1 toxin co-regulated pilus biosynthesis Q family protein [Aestuariibacter sp. AA17]